MSNKTVIVTGASTGIGKAIAKLFLERGANLIINARNKQSLLETFEEFGEPQKVKMVVGDVGDKSLGKALVHQAMESFGSVDVLINNAGVFSPKPFLEVTENELNNFFRINLKGTFFTAQAAITRMLNNKNGGAIINIGTVLVNHAIAGFPATAPVASKGGVHALTLQLAAEFGSNNIRVNTIAPGIIKSPLQAKMGIDDVNGLAGLHLLNKVGNALEVAKAACFLADNDFITGEILNVDGGHVAGHRFG